MLSSMKELNTEIVCHFVRHHLKEGTLKFLPVFSTDQITDVFTKTHLPCQFQESFQTQVGSNKM